MTRSRRPPAINPEQGSLLQQDPEGDFVAAETFPAAPESDPQEQKIFPTTQGPPGSYVDVAERARHLAAALTDFGRRNQRLGFDLASNARQYGGPIRRRYGRGVPNVQEGARANSERFLQDAKTSFWQATGYGALKGSKLVSGKEIDASGRKMWRDFFGEYGTTGDRSVKKRDAYKTTLRKSARTARKIIKQAAATETPDDRHAEMERRAAAVTAQRGLSVDGNKVAGELAGTRTPKPPPETDLQRAIAGRRALDRQRSSGEDRHEN